MAGTLKTASLEEWVSILRKNKGLPPESRRYFIIDCIIEDEELDRMYIEVDRDAYDEWHRDNQAAYRNRITKNLFLHLSLDAVVDNAEGVGKYEYQGSISASVSFSYFPYHVADKTIFTIDVVEEIYPEYQYWQLVREMNALQLNEEVLYRSFETLSKL